MGKNFWFWKFLPICGNVLCTFARPARQLCLSCPWEQGLVLTRRAQRADSVTVAPAAVAHVVIVRIEAEAPRVVRVVRVERTRPVVAATASVVELAIPAAASGGQEETITIERSEQTTLNLPPLFPPLPPLPGTSGFVHPTASITVTASRSDAKRRSAKGTGGV